MHLNYIVNASFNLAVLLIDMQEKLNEAIEHFNCECSCVKFQQGFEEQKLQTIFRENILWLSVVWFHEKWVLAFLSIFEYVWYPSKKKVSFLLIKSILYKNFPKDLQLLGIEQMFWILDNESFQEVEPFNHLSVETKPVYFVRHHRVKERSVATRLLISCAYVSLIFFFCFFPD